VHPLLAEAVAGRPPGWATPAAPSCPLTSTASPSAGRSVLLLPYYLYSANPVLAWLISASTLAIWLAALEAAWQEG
jgi:hypothetical protein